MIQINPTKEGNLMRLKPLIQSWGGGRIKNRSLNKLNKSMGVVSLNKAGKMLGIVTIDFQGNLLIVTNPCNRRKGIGQVLLKDALKQCQEIHKPVTVSVASDNLGCLSIIQKEQRLDLLAYTFESRESGAYTALHFKGKY